MVLVSALFNCELCCAQTTIYPNQFSTFFRSYEFINPSTTSKWTKTDLNITHQQFLGEFRIIRTTYANANISLQSKKDENKSHGLGIVVFSNKRGNVIGRTRAYFNYAYHTSLSENLNLSGGAMFGVLNQSFTGPDASTTGSATRPDANVGIWLSNDFFDFGVSINQLFNGEYRPINETFTLKRHYNINASLNFQAYSELNLKPIILMRFVDVQTVNVDLGLISLVKNIYQFGMTYRNKRSFSLFLGLDKFPFYAENLKFTFAYNIPVVASGIANIHSLEFSIGYTFK